MSGKAEDVVRGLIALGDILYVTGELNGWYLGKTQDGSRVGIFPSNYVTML